MIIKDTRVLMPEPILAFIAAASGRFSGAKILPCGIYEINHFGGSHFLREMEHYPESLSVPSCGVCDSPEQLIEKCPELSAADREFVVTVTRLRRQDEPDEGGWRWHKWGEYIGTKNPQHEYLYDETEIDEIFVYHIYEKK